MSTGTASEDVRAPLIGRSVARYTLILGSLSAFAPLSIDMYLPSLPSMTSDLHSTDSTIQLTLSAFIIGLAIGQIVIGPLSDSLGRRKPLLVGLVLYAVGSVLCAVSPSSELLITARFVQAIGAAAGIVIARAAVRDLFSGTAMTKFFSLLMLVNGVAPVLAPVIGAQLLRLTSWRGVFVVLTVVGVLLLATVALALPESLPAEQRTRSRISDTLRTYAGLFADRMFLGYALAAGLSFAAMFAYISGSSFVLQGVYGLNPQWFSVVFGINGLGIVAVGQLNSKLIDHFTERTLLTVGLVATAAGGVGVLLAATLDLGLIALLVPLFVLVGSIGMVSPNSTSLAMAEHAKSAGSASALLGVLQFAFGAIASPLVGVGGASGAAIPMAVVMAGFGVASLGAYLTLARKAA
jgi:DHA1 family bicyclomycin/chloramphenicol resistance-like MFS transporter